MSSKIEKNDDQKVLQSRLMQPDGASGSETEPAPKAAEDAVPHERGGPKGPEPTRFGDWENNGRCTDF